MQADGVIKFGLDHHRQPLETRRFGALASTLIAWREILALTGLVGQDPARYEGAGYGNISGRVGAPSVSRGQRSFLITGSQTSGLRTVSLADFALVERYDYRRNEATSVGEIEPSSESLTHGALYDLTPTIRFVMHAHAPLIWSQARELGLPTTDAAAAYGSVAMAQEVQRLYHSSALSERRVLAMGGHQDGVITFGRNADETATVLLQTLAAALERRALGAAGSLSSRVA